MRATRNSDRLFKPNPLLTGNTVKYFIATIFCIFIAIDILFVLNNHSFIFWISYWLVGCTLLSTINGIIYFHSNRETPCRANHDNESPDLLFNFYDKNIFLRSTIGTFPFLMTTFNKFDYTQKPIHCILAKRATGRKLYENWLLVFLFGSYLFFYIDKISTIKAHFYILFFIETIGLNIVSLIERAVRTHD